jgi:hypothetical protein
MNEMTFNSSEKNVQTLIKLTSFLVVLFVVNFSFSQSEIYELRVYEIDFFKPEKVLHDHFQNTLIPALNRQGVDHVGVFEELGDALPKKVETFLAKFPDDAKNWKDATDELKDLCKGIREYYVELDQDLTYSDKKALKPLDFKKFKTPKSWNKKSKEYIRNTWSKMGKESRKKWLKEWNHWFKK